MIGKEYYESNENNVLSEFADIPSSTLKKICESIVHSIKKDEKIEEILTRENLFTEYSLLDEVFGVQFNTSVDAFVYKIRQELHKQSGSVSSAHRIAEKVIDRGVHELMKKQRYVVTKILS